MKVTREKEENCQAFLTVEMEPADVEDYLQQAYRRLVKKMTIPGFRQGKAPRGIMERYMGREKLMEEALHDMLPQAYQKAIAEQEINAFAQPEAEIAGTDPVVLKYVIPLPPVVKLGNYTSIRLNQETVAVGEDDVNGVIEQARHQNAVWEPVERPADFNDMAVLNIESNIGGEPFLNRLGVQYHIVEERTFPVPGFAGQIVGTKTGETREFTLKFPDDFTKEDLAGKEVSFKVAVTEIKEEKLPELNDDFAKQISGELENVAAMRERVARNLQVQAEDRAGAEFEQKVIDNVVELSELEFPPVLVAVEIDNLIREQLRRYRMSDDRLDDYLKIINKTNDELREELRPLATTRVKRSLVLGKVIEAEKVEVGDGEVDSEIERTTKDVAEKKEELVTFLNSPQARQQIRDLLVERKVVQRLVELARGEDVNTKTEQEEGKE